MRTPSDHQITPDVSGPPSTALTPADLQSAYDLPSGGSGQTVAVVDWGDDANAETDLATFRSQYGLPPCTTANGCFEKVNEQGQQSNYPPDQSAGLEISLDVDAVSAACPSCNILLVEATSSSFDDVGASVDEAVSLGAMYVSNSYGTGDANGGEVEDPAETSLDHYYDHPGVAVTASAGDGGWGVGWPAADPNLVSVGGTRLTKDASTSRGWDETVWGNGTEDAHGAGTGSGCSQFEPQPAFQGGIPALDAACPDNRAVADISADADPASGLAVYDTDPADGVGGWIQVGGTSLSSPLIASMYALAGTPTSGTFPVTYPYQDRQNQNDLNDVTSGSNGDCGNVLCNAAPGWDGPTGLGTPNGVSALANGPRGDIVGTITDTSTGDPIAGAIVSVPGTSAGITDADGKYDLLLPPGTHDLTISAFGYDSKTITGVQVTDGTATMENVSLQPSPSVTVSGTITDGSGHGWPLYTRIDVATDPNGPSFTDPISGHYSIKLPANASYDVTFTSQLTGYQVVEQTIDVGGSDLTHDVAIPVTADCTAPGYTLSDALHEDFDSSNNFPPPGWSVVDNAGQGHVWQLNDPNGLPNYTGGTGNFADINSFYYGPGDTQDTSLVTPTLDLSGAAAPQLTFHNNYLASPGPETGDVDVSTDGGSTWTNVWHHGEDLLQGPDLEKVQLPAEANQSGVKLRFHFTATFSYWWMIDDVTVLKCVKLQGGLVEGNVSDLSTGDPIIGAKVTSGDHPADNETTVATPDDPTNPGGYYWLFSSLTGSHPLTASKSLYSPDTRTVDVAAGGIVRQDFTLGSGHLMISPTSISKTQVLGTTTTATLQFHNDGTIPAHVKLSGRGGSFQILHQQGSKLDTINLDQPANPGWLGDRKPGDTPGVSADVPTDPTWSTIANYPTGIEDNSADMIDGKEYSVGGVDSSGINTRKGYVYNPDDNTWSAIANMSQPRAKPGVAAVNGKLYVTGGWNTSGTPIAATEVYDPASDSWTTVAPNPSPTAAPGVAVVNNKIYFVGGCVDSSCTPSSKVEVYDPASDSWDSAANYPSGVTWEGCGGINRQVYCAGGLNGPTSLSTGYVYHPVSDSWSPIANLPIDLWGMVAGAPNGMLVLSSGVANGLYTITNQGFAYDPSADTWTAIPNAQFPRYRAAGSCGFYKIGGSDGSNLTPDSEFLSELDQCSPKVPWLGESPTEFDVPVNDTVDVTITVSATMDAGVTQPGTNSAQLVVNANTPQTITPIDVTMNVTPPKGWAKLAGTVTGIDCNGNTNPLQGAQVEADGKGNSFSLNTDKDGNYAFWAPTKANPFTVIASNLGYKAQTKTVKLEKGSTVTVNFALQAIC